MAQNRVLPKNFRQIGEKEDRIKIYLEDYVHAFLSKCRREPEEIHVGVLLGIHEVREGVPCLFICGLVETKKAGLSRGRLMFQEDTWDDVLRQMNEYFPDMGICGWFVQEKCGMSVDRLSLQKTCREMFSEGDKVLLLASEGEEAFYILRDGDMVKMMGYYIYFEQNEAMQAYLVRFGRQGRVDEQPLPDAGKTFRERFRERQGLGAKPEGASVPPARKEKQASRLPRTADAGRGGRDHNLRRWLEAACVAAAVLVLAWILGVGGAVLQEESREAATAAAVGENVSAEASETPGGTE